MERVSFQNVLSVVIIEKFLMKYSDKTCEEYCHIQGVPGGMDKTSGGCSLC